MKTRSGCTSLLFVLLPSFVSAGSGIGYELQPVAGGFDRVTNLVHAPAAGNWTYLTEQPGRIRILQPDGDATTVFLDITDRVRSVGFEQGLTGLAFAPAFPTDPTFYVHYIRNDFDGVNFGSSVISRFSLSGSDPLQADAASEQVLLEMTQPHPTHNCNQLKFGADGYLYIGCGDGGPPRFPVNDPQDPQLLYGKVLRLDVSTTSPGLPYAIPPGNPFANGKGGAAEVWSVGLRNPFRFSFDAVTGDMWIGDVGQDSWEEVSLIEDGTAAPANLGWDFLEGTHCYPAGSVCDPTGTLLPVIEYQHDVNGRCSVIGGERLRVAAIPYLEGRYVYADFCSGEIFAADPGKGPMWQSEVLLDSTVQPTTFGVDVDGDLLVGTYGLGNAAVYRLRISDALFADGFEIGAQLAPTSARRLAP